MTMRRYAPHWESVGISQKRYGELKQFCEQYPEWKTEAASLLGPRGVNLDGMPHGSGAGNPTASAAERRAGLMAKIQLVDDCAASVENGKWYAALILNVCLKRRYSDLDVTVLPNSNRNAFFAARKLFFIALDKVR